MANTMVDVLARLSLAIDRLDAGVDQALARVSERTELLAQKNVELEQQAFERRELAVSVSARLDDVTRRLQAALKE